MDVRRCLVADELGFDRPTYPLWTGRAVAVDHAADGLAVEREVERRVDVGEDGGEFRSTVDDEDAGDECGVVGHSLGDPCHLRAVGKSQRVTARTEGVGGLAPFDGHVEICECSRELVGQRVVAILDPRSKVADGFGAGERERRLAVVGDRPATDAALDGLEVVSLGRLAGAIVAVPIGVPPAERDLSVRGPDADRPLARCGDLEETAAGLAVGRDGFGPATEDVCGHDREFAPDDRKRSRSAISHRLIASAPDGRKCQQHPRAGMAVVLGDRVLGEYQRFSLYNSPYPAHDAGCAIDCYPEGSDPHEGVAEVAPSPVTGVVRETRTVRAPPKPYAPDHDHLLLIDVEEPASAAGLVARILHVDPAIEAGDRVEIGDPLGQLVRAGFFAPWVGTHLHVGFREPEQNLHRASGSLSIELDVAVRALPWDGTGAVVATGETYVVLDAPAHPDPGSWVAIAADCGRVLDGGIPHYDGGGALGSESDGEGSGTDDPRPVGLNGDVIGAARGRTIAWDDVTVLANGEPVTGLSLFCARDAGFGAKVICPDHDFAVGDRLAVRARRR